mmetsp:Transcript_5383/g.17980  ORF Transcript_5383/g.17980 Transcript_5383/m.17980 type:complete len:247 (+) Transcript_5383:913-1653(+)
MAQGQLVLPRDLQPLPPRVCALDARHLAELHDRPRHVAVEPQLPPEEVAVEVPRPLVLEEVEGGLGFFGVRPPLRREAEEARDEHVVEDADAREHGGPGPALQGRVRQLLERGGAVDLEPEELDHGQHARGDEAHRELRGRHAARDGALVVHRRGLPGEVVHRRAVPVARHGAVEGEHALEEAAHALLEHVQAPREVALLRDDQPRPELLGRHHAHFEPALAPVERALDVPALGEAFLAHAHDAVD